MNGRLVARMGVPDTRAVRERSRRDGFEHGDPQHQTSREAEIRTYGSREDELRMTASVDDGGQAGLGQDDYAGQCQACGRQRFDLQLVEYARSQAWWVCRVCFEQWADEWLIPPDTFTTAKV